MTANPLVSVIIPAFNTAGVIRQTLDSVRAQTYQNYEVIVADDSSTDDTAAIVHRLSASDVRFAVVSHAHSGISATRNRAIESARGEWVAFLDSDDVWLPEKLSCQVEMVSRDPKVNFSFTNYFLWDGEKDLGVMYSKKERLPEGDVAAGLIFSNRFGISTVMVRRDILHQAGLFDPQVDVCEDWDLWLCMADCGLFAGGIRQPLVRYRRWAGSVSMNRMRTAQYNVLVLEKNMSASRRPELLPLYQRALNLFRSRRELARARQLLDSSPGKVPAAIWRAWRMNPREAKWLLRWLLSGWPKVLGGRFTAAGVHHKLREKF